MKQRLEKSDNKIDNSAKKLQEQIKNEIKSVVNDFKTEMNNLLTELKRLLEEELIQKEINDNVNLSNIDDRHPIITAVASSLFTGAFVSGSIILVDTAGTTAAGLLISGAALGWGIAIWITTLSIQNIYNIYTGGTKYKKIWKNIKKKWKNYL